MKKKWLFILFIPFICFFNSCETLPSSLKTLDYPQPEFDKPLAYIIDSTKINGSFADNIKLYNTSNNSNINFRIYLHLPERNEWMIYGVGNLKDPGDVDTINSGISGIHKYRYFAIEPMDGKDYKYEFYTNRNDLHINIIDD